MTLADDSPVHAASPSRPAKRKRGGGGKKAAAADAHKLEGSSTKQTQGQERSGGDDADLADLRQRLAFLCHDLRTFSANKDAARRLDASVHAHFLGPPYLSDAQAERVRGCTLAELRQHEAGAAPGEGHAAETPHDSKASSGKTLVAFLEEGMGALVAARRAKSEGGDGEGGGGGGGSRDFVLCTSHDLAPLLQEACGFSKERFETRAFKDAYKRWEKEVRKADKKGKGAA